MKRKQEISSVIDRRWAWWLGIMLTGCGGAQTALSVAEYNSCADQADKAFESPTCTETVAALTKLTQESPQCAALFKSKPKLTCKDGGQ